jgi:hypothetical protein
LRDQVMRSSCALGFSQPRKKRESKDDNDKTYCALRSFHDASAI